MIREAIALAVDKKDLTADQMTAAWEEITSGQATSAQIAALVTALRMKGETVEEISAAAQVMRNKATRIELSLESCTGSPHTPPLLVDTCGTGGDQTNTFNISTCAALVVAGAGVRVAKHGNRSVSSSCGSADVWEALGIHLSLTPVQTAACIREVGMGFLFAPALHGTMKHAVSPRKEIGIRTIFNLLGPLSNPAGARVQVVGVFRRDLTETIAAVLGKLRCDRAFVVHGEDGMDEITTTGRTIVCELDRGILRNHVFHPEEFGLEVSRPHDLRGTTARENAQLILELLQGRTGARRDIVLLNAGAALYLAGAAATVREGISKAAHAIDEGKALERLRRLIEFSHRVRPGDDK